MKKICKKNIKERKERKQHIKHMLQILNIFWNIVCACFLFLILNVLNNMYFLMKQNQLRFLFANESVCVCLHVVQFGLIQKKKSQIYNSRHLTDRQVDWEQHSNLINWATNLCLFKNAKEIWYRDSNQILSLQTDTSFWIILISLFYISVFNNKKENVLKCNRTLMF